MSQISHFNMIRPATSCGFRNKNVVNQELVESDELKKFRSSFPNLPGFSKHSSFRPQSPKNQSLSFKNGYMMVNSPINSGRFAAPRNNIHHRPLTAPVSTSIDVYSPNDSSGRYSLSRKRLDREKNKISLPFCPASKLPTFLEHDRRVLLFNAYYEEDVLQSAIETKRVLRCDFYFYVEDGTIEIIQTKQQNSGMPQGVFLRRSRVEKPQSLRNNSSEESQYYEINDLKLGNEVEIYSRKFHIVNCNESTKQYVIETHNWQSIDVAPLQFPRDVFEEANKAKMKRECGVEGVDRKRKMHELKEVMESMLGKQTSTTDRGMFLECGQNALCFHAMWDDRERLFGDIQYFRVFYYLADDTIEILPVHTKNNGRDQFPKLLKRSKLPKTAIIPTNDGTDEYYFWEDLSIGCKINVFGRTMQLARCDSFTRQHYSSVGIVLKDDMPLEPVEEKVEFIRQIPPYNGFGSEEDSMRSCTGGINPPPPKKDLAKMRDKRGVILRFSARLLTDKTDDDGRRFVIQYFMEDDTIAIREPPIRNSGVMGGSFLRRQVIKKTDGKKYVASDLYVGNIVDFMSHRFELLHADEYTYRLMENDERNFPCSNFCRLHDLLTTKKEEVKRYFLADHEGAGKISISDFTACCKKIQLNLNKQEVLTLWRKLDKKGKGKISFAKVVKMSSDELLAYH